jgi:hypothetical protein
VKAAKKERVRKIVAVLEKKAGQLPQYQTVPLSSKTAISDFIANRKYAPPAPNEYTTEERRLIARLLENMSKSRARVVDAHRRGRKSVQQLFQASGLWG